MRTLSKCGAVVLPVNSVGEDMAITDTLLFYLRMCTVLCKYLLILMFCILLMIFTNHFSGPGRAVLCVCVCLSVCLRVRMVTFELHSVSKNIPPLQLAIIFTYTVRLRQFVAQMLPRK